MAEPINEFKDEFADTFVSSNIIPTLDVTDHNKDVFGENLSMPALMTRFINAQAQSQTEIFKALASEDVDKQTQINNWVTKSNIVARKMEEALMIHCNKNEGIDTKALQFLINTPPDTYGIETKCSDSALKTLDTFSGDYQNNESALTTFLRDVFALSSTNNLTEATTIAVLTRKLAGTAHILIDSYIESKGGLTNVTIKGICHQLERKFIVTYTPLAADTKLHSLSQGSMTYPQLQAQVTKLVKLACRLEDEATRPHMIKLKETSCFLLALSQEDRHLITLENTQRANASLQSLNLEQMVDFLIKSTADRLSLREAVMHVGGGSSAAILPSTAPPSDPNLEGTVSAVSPYIPQGASRGRGQRRGRGRGRGYQRENMPDTQFRGRGKNNSPQPFNTHNDKVNKGRNFQMRGQAKGFVDHKLAGVSEHACLHCGSLTHKLNSKSCPYHDTPLYNAPCRCCGKGAHMTALCVAVPQK